MKYDYWAEFWSRYGQKGLSSNEQEQVLRTFNKRAIKPELWKFTLEDIDKKFPVGSDDDLLDLCCGNGLLARHYASKCRSITGVDISTKLIEVLEKRDLDNVKTELADIRKVDFSKNMFSRILFYAGIQYLTEAESIDLFHKFVKWLRPGGLLFIGDIPDRRLIWTFYDTPDRQKIYFDNYVVGKDVVGTWFDRDWLEKLSKYAGFQRSKALNQHPNLIYAKFRFDLVCKR